MLNIILEQLTNYTTPMSTLSAPSPEDCYNFMFYTANKDILS